MIFLLCLLTTTWAQSSPRYPFDPENPGYPPPSLPKEELGLKYVPAGQPPVNNEYKPPKVFIFGANQQQNSGLSQQSPPNDAYILDGLYPDRKSAPYLKPNQEKPRWLPPLKDDDYFNPYKNTKNPDYPEPSLPKEAQDVRYYNYDAQKTNENPAKETIFPQTATVIDETYPERQQESPPTRIPETERQNFLRYQPQEPKYVRVLPETRIRVKEYVPEETRRRPKTTGFEGLDDMENLPEELKEFLRKGETGQKITLEKIPEPEEPRRYPEAQKMQKIPYEQSEDFEPQRGEQVFEEPPKRRQKVTYERFEKEHQRGDHVFEEEPPKRTQEVTYERFEKEHQRGDQVFEEEPPKRTQEVTYERFEKEPQRGDHVFEEQPPKQTQEVTYERFEPQTFEEEPPKRRQKVSYERFEPQAFEEEPPKRRQKATYERFEPQVFEEEPPKRRQQVTYERPEVQRRRPKVTYERLPEERTEVDYEPRKYGKPHYQKIYFEEEERPRHSKKEAQRQKIAKLYGSEEMKDPLEFVKEQIKKRIQEKPEERTEAYPEYEEHCEECSKCQGSGSCECCCGGDEKVEEEGSQVQDAEEMEEIERTERERRGREFQKKINKHQQAFGRRRDYERAPKKSGYYTVESGESR